MFVKKTSAKDKKYKVLILGAGRIASGFDTPKSKEVLTHAHAFIKHPKTELVGFFDVNQKVAKAAAQKWGVESFVNLEKTLREVQPDIVSICTPDETHEEMLRLLAKYPVRLVICEKPLVTNIESAQNILKEYQKKSIALAVNYSRRYDVTLQKLAKDIQSGKFGKVLLAAGIYSKGLLHNGSHLLDIARVLLGEVKKVKPIFGRNDYKQEDPSIAAVYSFERCEQCFIGVGDDRKYGVFELDILCEKKRFRLTDFGFHLSMQSVEEDKLYKGFFGLGKTKQVSTDLPYALDVLVKNVVDHLERKVPLLCSGNDAFETQKVIQSVFKQW